MGSETGLRGLEWCLMPMVVKSLSPSWDAVPNTAAAGFSAEPSTAPLLQARAHSEAPHTAFQAAPPADGVQVSAAAPSLLQARGLSHGSGACPGENQGRRQKLGHTQAR